MGRPKKDRPNRADGRYQTRRTIGHNADGSPIVKYFYSTVSIDDAKRQAREYVENPAEYENMPFEQWAKRWLTTYKEDNVKESTFQSSYKRPTEQHIIPYFKRYMIGNIRPADVQQFFNDMSVKYSSTYLAKMRICLNGIFETAIENDVCRKNPCKNVIVKSKIKKEEKRTYTKKEADEILKLCDQHRYGHYIRISLQLGLRPSELCGLKWEDFDFENKTVTISRACTDLNGIPVIDKPKSDTSIRTIPVPNDLIEALKKVPEEHKGYLIISPSGKNISPKSYSERRYLTFFKEMNIERVLNPHELRHTCGTLLWEKTHDLYALSKFLGHSTVAITAKLYVHGSPEALREALFSED